MIRSTLIALVLLTAPATLSAQPPPVTPTPNDFSRDRDCLSRRTYRADAIDAIPGADGAEWELYRAGTRIDGGPRSLNRGRFVLRLNLHDYGPVLDGTAYGVRIRATGGGDPVAEWSETTRFDDTAAVAAFDAGTNGVVAFSWDVGPVLSECADGGVLEIERDGVIVETYPVDATAGNDSRPLGEYAPGTYLARFRAHSGSTDPEDAYGLPADPVEFTIPPDDLLVQRPGSSPGSTDSIPATPTPRDTDRRGRCLAERHYLIADLGSIPGADGAEWELSRSRLVVDRGHQPLDSRGRFRLRRDLRDFGAVLRGIPYSLRVRATAAGEPVAEWSESVVFDETASVRSFSAVPDSGAGRIVFSWNLGSPVAECADGGGIYVTDAGGRPVDGYEVTGASGSETRPVDAYEPGRYTARFIAHWEAVFPDTAGGHDAVGLSSDPVEFTIPDRREPIVLEPVPPESEPETESQPEPEPDPGPQPVAVRIQALDRAGAACVARPPAVTGAEIAVFLDEKLVATGKTGAGGAAFDLLPGVYRVVARAGHCEETTSEMRVPGGSPIGVPLEGCLSKDVDLAVSLPYLRTAAGVMRLRRQEGFPVGPLPVIAVVRNVGKGISGRAGLRIERIEGRKTVALGPGTRAVDPICAGEERSFTLEDPDAREGVTYTYRARIFTADARTDNNAGEVEVTAP